MTFLLYFAAAMIAEGASYRPLRYTHVTGQANWYTCGAAVSSLSESTLQDKPGQEVEATRITYTG